MCIMDLRIAQRLTPVRHTVTTPSVDFNPIPDVSRAYLIQVVSNTAINPIKWRTSGPNYAALPQRLDLSVQRDSIGAGLVDPVYSREVLAAFAGRDLGVGDSAMEGQVVLIYWEMDADTMHEVYGPIS